TGWLTANPLATQAWLFVDFFFVLSGFVIAASYRARIAEGFSVARFMGLRLGRVYPLHLAVLLLMAALVPLTHAGGFMGDRSWPDFVRGLLLLNAQGLDHRAGWNIPSWSIAAEVWTYLLFALVVRLAGRRALMVFALLAVAALLIVARQSPTGLDTTYDWGVVRCIYGFSLGMIVQAARTKAGIRFAGVLEMGCALLALLTVTYGDYRGVGLAAPLVFAALIYVYSFQAGPLSRLLLTPVPMMLGTWSYSIYMIHWLVLYLAMGLLGKVGETWHIALIPVQALGPALTVQTENSALTLLLVAIVIGCARLSYRFIERPARAWSRKILMD
ncbi:MAG: acyltransferase, partial [Alphaproteobacteria bacterium]|nr:acyltransferase [Alphaproteobacteria bacterium]